MATAGNTKLPEQISGFHTKSTSFDTVLNQYCCLLPSELVIKRVNYIKVYSQSVELLLIATGMGWVGKKYISSAQLILVMMTHLDKDSEDDVTINTFVNLSVASEDQVIAIGS